MAQPTPKQNRRYLVTRVVGAPKVPKRYRFTGWIVFDTHQPLADHRRFETRAAALAHVQLIETLFTSKEQSHG